VLTRHSPSPPLSTQLSASFYQLAAEQGNSNSMVALGNYAISVAENAHGIIALNSSFPPDASNSNGSRGSSKDVSDILSVDKKTLKAYEFIRSHSLRLGMSWYEKACQQEPPHKDALFNMGQVCK
jgi:TPR repeat protein